VDVDGPDTFERMMMGSRSNLYYTNRSILFPIVTGPSATLTAV
jgi:hypothetical protein